jgi:hypothetical protein
VTRAARSLPHESCASHARAAGGPPPPRLCGRHHQSSTPPRTRSRLCREIGRQLVGALPAARRVSREPAPRQPTPLASWFLLLRAARRDATRSRDLAELRHRVAERTPRHGRRDAISLGRRPRRVVARRTHGVRTAWARRRPPDHGGGRTSRDGHALVRRVTVMEPHRIARRAAPLS